MILYGKEKSERLPKNFKNIILTGICGSGKTAIGKQLARRLGFGYLDLDDWIEKSEKKTIPRIFKDHGEAYFRKKETEALSSIKSAVSQVISLGGGAMQAEQNWELIDGLGVTVWLQVSPNAIAKRFASHPEELKKRPLLSDIAGVADTSEREQLLVDRLTSQLQDRREGFEHSHLCFNDSFATNDEAANRIKQLLEGKEGQKLLKKNAKR
ncbi:MAG: AAA family ATPase [Oligoflexales bacterium]|nr:AAA family ATPase [Oligoflexales bacterium]